MQLANIPHENNVFKLNSIKDESTFQVPVLQIYRIWKVVAFKISLPINSLNPG